MNLCVFVLSSLWSNGAQNWHNFCGNLTISPNLNLMMGGRFFMDLASRFFSTHASGESRLQKHTKQLINRHQKSLPEASTNQKCSHPHLHSTLITHIILGTTCEGMQYAICIINPYHCTPTMVPAKSYALLDICIMVICIMS